MHVLSKDALPVVIVAKKLVQARQRAAERRVEVRLELSFHVVRQSSVEVEQFLQLGISGVVRLIRSVGR